MSLSDEQIERHVRRLGNAWPEYPAEIERRRQAFKMIKMAQHGPRYWEVHVEVGASDFLRAWRWPSQYTTFQFGALAPRFLVIANAPPQCLHRRHASEPGWEAPQVWEFLIDRASSLGEALEDAKNGDKVILSLPEGDGFDTYDESAEHDGSSREGASRSEWVRKREFTEGAEHLEKAKIERAPNSSAALLFATGSGVASLRPLIQSWIEGRVSAPQFIALYYGEDAPQDFAYVSEFHRWKQKGLHLVCVSPGMIQPPPLTPLEKLPVGLADLAEQATRTPGIRFVQDAFEVYPHPQLSSLTSESASETMQVYLSGAPIMMRHVAAMFLQRGLSPTQIYTNI